MKNGSTWGKPDAHALDMRGQTPKDIDNPIAEIDLTTGVIYNHLDKLWDGMRYTKIGEVPANERFQEVAKKAV